MQPVAGRGSSLYNSIQRRNYGVWCLWRLSHAGAQMPAGEISASPPTPGALSLNLTLYCYYFYPSSELSFFLSGDSCFSVALVSFLWRYLSLPEGGEKTSIGPALSQGANQLKISRQNIPNASCE